MASNAMAAMTTIERFIQQVGAQEKRAEANTEAGSIGGETSHPVKDVDDRTDKAKEGFRSAENAADVKADQGKPSVESTPEATSEGEKKGSEGKSTSGDAQSPGSAPEDQLQIGTNKQPTGEDSSVETSSAKGGKEDPGSSHPARTDNDELDGHKYAADQLNNMPMEKLAQLVANIGDNLCAVVANMEPSKQASATPATPATPAPSGDKQAEDASLAQQAGWELAGLLTNDFDKQAADAMVQQTLEEIIKTAADDAVRVATFLEYYSAQKQANEGAMMDPAAMDPAMMGGAPEGGGPEGGGEDMLAALGGAGGLPPEEAGGDPGMGGDDQVAKLLQVLEQLGITPEELEAAMAQEAGGPPPDMAAAGGPPPGGPPVDEKAAASKKGNAHDGIREYIMEVVSRSRAAR